MGIFLALKRLYHKKMIRQQHFTFFYDFFILLALLLLLPLFQGLLQYQTDSFRQPVPCSDGHHRRRRQDLRLL
jgi:hypothetical protein